MSAGQDCHANAIFDKNNFLPTSNKDIKGVAV